MCGTGIKGNSAFVNLGMSTSGVQYAGIAYFNSLATGWSWATTPIPVVDLASKAAGAYERVRSFINRFAAELRSETPGLDEITATAQALLGE